MVHLRKISPCWTDFCIVAGSGPSLTPEVADLCRGFPVIAVNDAWRQLPFADVLYACDAEWWRHHRGCPEFAGERWSLHGNAMHNDKGAVAEQFGLSLVKGTDGEGFSFDPAVIHYGEMGGFQAVNMAGHRLGWKGRIVLVGFEMTAVEGHRHFFGEHPKGLRATRIGRGGAYERGIACFERAAKTLPTGIEIVNCTPASALRAFRMMDLRDALPAAH